MRILGESRSRQQGDDYACLDEFPLHACSYTRFVAATRLGRAPEVYALLLEHVPPQAVPVGAGNVGDAAVLLEELVGQLEHG